METAAGSSAAGAPKREEFQGQLLHYTYVQPGSSDKGSPSRNPNSGSLAAEAGASEKASHIEKYVRKKYTLSSYVYLQSSWEDFSGAV